MMMSVGRRRVAVVAALVAVRGRGVAVVAAVVGAVVRRRVLVVRGAVAAVEGLLGVRDLFELAAVEEDSSAALALLDVYASPVDGMHHVLTFRTDHATERTCCALD